jgi:hydroxyacylglutathione hydrolase
MNVLKLQNSPYDSNVYLVNNTILIDVGMDAGSIITQLDEQINPGDLKTIILTHCHYDHSAGAADVAEAFGAKIAIHRDDAPLLNNSRGSVSELFGMGELSIIPDVLLSGGEVFDTLEVIHTPGHTPGGICLYDAISKSLFSGDTVFQDGSFGRTDLYGGNAEKLIESIKKLTLLNVSIMYPGHGDIVKENVNTQISMSLLLATQYSGI